MFFYNCDRKILLLLSMAKSVLQKKKKKKTFSHRLQTLCHVHVTRKNNFGSSSKIIMVEHDGRVSIGGRTMTNLRFADDIDALAEEEQDLEALVESLDKTCTRYKMEISAEKTKLMTNSTNGIL